MGLKNLVLMVVLVCSCASCASAIRGSKQTVALQPYDVETGDLVTCMCNVRNDDGSSYERSSVPVIVGRDKDWLYVDCKNDKYEGSAKVDGKVDVGFILADLCIDYCTISGLVDGCSGAWSSYPNVIRIPMYLITQEENEVR